MGTGLPNRECWTTNCWGGGGELGCVNRWGHMSAPGGLAPRPNRGMPDSTGGLAERPLNSNPQGIFCSSPVITSLKLQAVRLSAPRGACHCRAHRVTLLGGFGPFCRDGRGALLDALFMKGWGPAGPAGLWYGRMVLDAALAKTCDGETLPSACPFAFPTKESDVLRNQSANNFCRVPQCT